MENDFLRIGILAGRGSDIFEFQFKPMNLDFMLRLAKGIQNPRKIFSQMRDTSNQFEDYYYGGWQEILPNSPGFNYRGASLGQHGEISLIPWKYSITNNSDEKISVTLRTKPLRIPIQIDKSLTLVADEPTLYIEEKLKNDCKTKLDIMWGHHIAFGLPFLKDGAEIESNADKIYSDPVMPDQRRFKPGIETSWPTALDLDGKEIKANDIPPESDSPYSELSYLYGYKDKGFYSIKNKRHQIGFRLDWDATLFKYVWMWQERYCSQDAPWWGDAYAIALEPWTSQWKPDPEAAIKSGEWLSLDAGEIKSTKLKASVVSD
jgi:galactose mutarotase-like enzyme